MPTHDELRFRILSFAQWRMEIAPLWAKEDTADSIHTILNGFGQIQYVGRELFSEMLVFPIAAELDGHHVGWTSVYNISATSIRIRGIYVLPDMRGQGIGHAMVQHAISLWPEPWSQCFMYARESNLPRYLERWGFAIAPGHRLRSFPWGEAVGEKRIVLVQKHFNSAAANERRLALQ